MIEATSKVRVTEIDNGNSITATSSDPYGHWKLHLKKGQLPEEYRGTYTTYEYAEKAIKKYLEDRGRAISDLPVPPPTPPVLKQPK
jgi:hypothetical protein